MTTTFSPFAGLALFLCGAIGVMVPCVDFGRELFSGKHDKSVVIFLATLFFAVLPHVIFGIVDCVATGNFTSLAQLQREVGSTLLLFGAFGLLIPCVDAAIRADKLETTRLVNMRRWFLLVGIFVLCGISSLLIWYFGSPLHDDAQSSPLVKLGKIFLLVTSSALLLLYSVDAIRERTTKPEPLIAKEGVCFKISGQMAAEQQLHRSSNSRSWFWFIVFVAFGVSMCVGLAPGLVVFLGPVAIKWLIDTIRQIRRPQTSNESIDGDEHLECNCHATAIAAEKVEGGDCSTDSVGASLCDNPPAELICMVATSSRGSSK